MASGPSRVLGGPAGFGLAELGQQMVDLGVQLQSQPGTRLRGEVGVETVEAVIVHEGAEAPTPVVPGGAVGLILAAPGPGHGVALPVAEAPEGLRGRGPEEFVGGARGHGDALGHDGGPLPGQLSLAEGVLDPGRSTGGLSD